MKRPRKSPKRKLLYTSIRVLPATREIARRLAATCRQNIAVVVDDALRAAYAREALITADEGQYSHHG